MTAQTTTQRTAAHRRRAAERLVRMTTALERISRYPLTAKEMAELARGALMEPDSSNGSEKGS